MKENPYQENQGNIKELLQRFENLKQGRRGSFIEEDAFERIIDYYLDTDDISLASEAADFAMEQYPYSATLLIKKADILLSSRNYQKALAMLNQAELLDNNDINLYILKTDVFLALDLQDKAVVLLEEALRLFDGEEKLELLFELADVYDDYEEFDKVFDCLKMILEQDPTSEEALYKICFWTDFTGRNEESIRLHQQIIDEYPYTELAWFNLGAAYQGLRLYEKAIDAYKYTITIDEKFDYAYRNMGDAYIRLRKYKDAIEVLDKVNELSKPESVIYEALGHCYERLKKYAQARFYYRKALHITPDDAKLIHKTARTYFYEEKWDSCCKLLLQAVKIQPGQIEYHLLMGESFLELQQYADAAKCFSAILMVRPRSVKGREALVRCLYLDAKYEEAMNQCRIGLEVATAKPLFLFYKAAIYLGLGKTKEAILNIEEALVTDAKFLKRFLELAPSALQHQAVIDIIARHKRKKTF